MHLDSNRPDILTLVWIMLLGTNSSDTIIQGVPESELDNRRQMVEQLWEKIKTISDATAFSRPKKTAVQPFSVSLDTAEAGAEAAQAYPLMGACTPVHDADCHNEGGQCWDLIWHVRQKDSGCPICVPHGSLHCAMAGIVGQSTDYFKSTEETRAFRDEYMMRAKKQVCLPAESLVSLPGIWPVQQTGSSVIPRNTRFLDGCSRKCFLFAVPPCVYCFLTCGFSTTG